MKQGKENPQKIKHQEPQSKSKNTGLACFYANWPVS